MLHTPTSNCLRLLLQHSGETLSQKFLFEHAWENKGIHATPNALYQNIAQIRKALKVLGLSESTIRTLPRAGFKLYADVQVITDHDAGVMTSPLVHPAEPAETTHTIKTPNSIKINDKVNPSESHYHESDALLEQQDGMQFIIEETTPPPYNKKYHLKQNWWKILMFGLLTFLISQLFYTKLITERSYFINYYDMGEINNCELHSSYYGRRESIDKVIALTKNNGLICPAEGHIYITINRVAKMATAIVCDRPIDSKDAHCDTYINNTGDINEN